MRDIAIDDSPFHLFFNTKTMSGIHPGSRTAQAHIVRLQKSSDGRDEGQVAPGWARILWPGEDGQAQVYWLENGRGWAEQPALHLSGVNGEKPVVELIRLLTGTGHPPVVCGTCRWWQPVAQKATPDGIPLGQCSWGNGGLSTLATDSRQQSALALECPHWQAGEQTPAPPVAEVAQAESIGWLDGLRRRFSGKTSGPTAAPVDVMAERSGVGAGTERCLACHGRIANLGALTVASESDDKRTLSIWRCRLCRTFYLNDWIDRWERQDNLETEESYYRIAPVEALDLLALFRQTAGGEHPKERHSRGAQRAQMDDFLADRFPLLHQIKLGR